MLREILVCDRCRHEVDVTETGPSRHLDALDVANAREPGWFSTGWKRPLHLCPACAGPLIELEARQKEERYSYLGIEQGTAGIE